ncbi:NAD(P)-dependent oxidoreductase [Ectobacillus ponti]|uniref:NAD(P)H-binding protein n=1 Tax=Ectobacillus ponti TaxID=2961894 RepID=A0AA42BPA5_9BACI|nr:NAD(P)H-binding protein [Ectobacillus ponti]MCP8968905.1 NAD(P)H-binding protein [Ectobacillus ponti]
MKLCILGATGRTGLHLVRLALAGGHDVKTLVRDAAKLGDLQGGVYILEGNAREAGDLSAAVSGCNAVISALGTDGNGTLSCSTPLLMEAMKQAGVSRLITIGTAGILQARSNPALYRFQSGESRRKSTAAAEDHLQAYLQLEQSDLDWTIVCPTHLIDGEAAGQYRTEKDMLPEDGLAITTGDTALFAYRQLFSDAYSRSRAGLAN